MSGRLFVGAIALVCALVLVGCGSPNCEANQVACGNSCIDPLSNNQNCGTCGTTCENGLVCGNGACGNGCPLGQEECGGTCAEVLSDVANCGGCGVACEAGDVCTDGICHAPCDPSRLMAAIEDPWGTTWDGLERAAAPLDAAEVDCATFGARLPSPTEMHRVSASQTGAVGESFHTNPLWSRTPND